MGIVIILSIPLAAVWMILTHEYSVASFIVGFIVSVPALVLADVHHSKFQITNLPSQIYHLGIYIVTLFWDILRSSFEVATYVLTADFTKPMEDESFIEKVSTQDDDANEIVAALSAYTITVTPGELVADFDRDENGKETIMYVHVLKGDRETTEQKLRNEQKKRLDLIRKVLGIKTS